MKLGEPPVGKMRYRGDPVRRFWSYVERAEPEQCWRWMGHANRQGYGRMYAYSRQYFAHRFSYRIHNDGNEPPVVRHTCDNPICVNPAHLLGGTQADNNRDTAERKRGTGGWTHCRKGHPFDEENTRRGANNQRYCRACNRAAVLAYAARKRPRATPPAEPQGEEA